MLSAAPVLALALAAVVTVRVFVAVVAVRCVTSAFLLFSRTTLGKVVNRTMVQLSLENAQAGWVAAEQLGALKIQVPVLRKLPPLFEVRCVVSFVSLL